jgi:heme/copper-type cytochrome/quinol oxidase subunit 2
MADSSDSGPLLSGNQITYIVVAIFTILVTAVLGFLKWYCRARMRQQQQQQSSAIPAPSTPNALITFGPE